MQIGNMAVRIYNPSEDAVVCNFSDADWQNIFTNTSETDLQDLGNCANVIILMWCDAANMSPHGMIYFEEDYQNPCEVKFHGGTWNHSPKYFREIFRTTTYLFDFILDFKETIRTSCSINNMKADKYQRSIGFEEVERDDTTIYKILNTQKFIESDFVNIMRIRN
jgi:hypothetical protein